MIHVREISRNRISCKYQIPIKSAITKLYELHFVGIEFREFWSVFRISSKLPTREFAKFDFYEFLECKIFDLRKTILAKVKDFFNLKQN